MGREKEKVEVWSETALQKKEGLIGRKHAGRKELSEPEGVEGMSGQPRLHMKEEEAGGLQDSCGLFLEKGKKEAEREKTSAQLLQKPKLPGRLL